MKRIWIGIACGLIGMGGRAQNLVPNGSFEEYTQCPEFFGFAQYATGWLNLHTGSADYFNSCQANQVVGVPFNSFGFQEPADGEAYVGCFTTVPGLEHYREIIGVELVQPLQTGISVCLSFKMAIGGFGSWNGNSATLTSKGLGIRFFNEYPTDWSTYLYPNSAALSLGIVPTDTAVWYFVSGEYTPDSNYTHMAIGNFYSDTISSITVLDTTDFGGVEASYAFIDDVSVSYDLQFCGSTSIHLIGTVRVIRAYPSPFVDRVTVELTSLPQGVVHWELVDNLGKPVSSGSSGSGARTFAVPAGHLIQGAYVLRLYDSAGVYAPVRLVSLSP